MATQKEIMVWSNLKAGGDKQETIALYAQYDAQGLAPRESDVTPRDSKDYATILWHTAIKLEWF